MRFDTHRVRTHIVWQLMGTPGITDIQDDGTDIVVVRTSSGARVMIHVVERLMPLIELRPLFRENSDAGIHTLPLFWADMLLPAHGQIYEPDEWMQALLRLQGDCIYGYEAFGEQVFLFGVHYRGRGSAREAEHSRPLDFRALHTATVDCDWPSMLGRWLVAGLGDVRSGEEAEQPLRAPLPFLHIDFERLNLPMDADFTQVQRAYRLLARRYHPDSNPAAEANALMQQINAAYARIRRQMLGSDSDSF